MLLTHFYSLKKSNILGFKIDLNILDQSVSKDLKVLNQEGRIENRFVRRQSFIRRFVSEARNELDSDRVRVPVEVEVGDGSKGLARLVDEGSDWIVSDDRKRFQRRRIRCWSVVRMVRLVFGRRNLKRLQAQDDVVGRQIAETKKTFFNFFTRNNFENLN